MGAEFKIVPHGTTHFAIFERQSDGEGWYVYDWFLSAAQAVAFMYEHQWRRT